MSKNYKIIESFFKNDCISFYDGNYNETLKDLKISFLEGGCLDEKIVDGKIVFFEDKDNPNVKYYEEHLASWYMDRCELPLGFPNLTEIQESWWYNDLTDLFKKNIKLVNAIDEEIRKLTEK